MSELRKLINIVSQALTESPDQLRTEIVSKVDKVKDEEDLSAILRYTNRYTIKGEVEKFAAVRQYKDIVSRVILKSLANNGVDEKRTKKFLNKLLTDGILDVKALLTPKIVHSAEDIIDPANKDVFDLIKIDLFQQIAGKIGEKGDVGKGEYLLDIISPKVNRRGAPGDLDVNGVKIELKAGENGRLGPSGSQSLVGRFDVEFLPVIKQLVPKKVKNLPNINAFNPKQDMSEFSDFFETPANIKAALSAILQMHYQNVPIATIKAMVSKIVSADGTINGQKLKSEMLKTSYSEYKKEKEFDGVIIMDAGVTSFLYVNTPEDIEAVANLLLVKFPSWTDAQSNCMKVTLSKASMGAGSAGKKSASSSSIDKETKSKVEKVAAGKTDIRPPGTAKAAAPATKTASAPRAKRK